MATLHSPGHAWPAGLPAPTVRLDVGGVMIGVDEHGLPAQLRLFRDRPTSVTVLGDSRLALLLAVRALGTGVRLRAVTPRPQLWTALATLTGAANPRVVTAPDQQWQQPDLPGSFLSPVLLVRDGADRRIDPWGASRWQSVLTVLPAVRSTELSELRYPDIVLATRLAPELGSAMGAMFGLSPTARQALTTVPDGWCVTLSGGAVRRVAIRPLADELRVIAQLPADQLWVAG